MSDEEGFQAHLDAHPDDWQCRLIFADWLEERGDVRAEGYRALGVLRRHPAHYELENHEWTWWRVPGSDTESNRLENDWWDLLAFWKYKLGHDSSYHKRREAEDAAARAFAKLPAPRRAELLSAPVPA